MKQIMTITMADRSEREIVVTESIASSNFYSFKGYDVETDEPIAIRVETEEKYTDRKSRGC